MTNCKRYEKCAAPLCPLDENLHIRKWYPDEEICKKQGEKPGWVKIQKRIKKKAKNRETYYTVEMLELIKKVYSSIKGANSDKEKAHIEWIKSFKKKRERNKKHFASLK